ncbi:CMBL Carboxymethylenebutenolidase, partial [Ardeotis kori]|nr:CMBL Carboxymethylenebutenolidase [Ardeotis kori]
MANEARPCPCDIGDRFDYGGRGQEVQVEHIKAYVCKPAASTDRAVIVIHDIFGWQLPNTRYMADMLATNGYIMLITSIFFHFCILNWESKLSLLIVLEGQKISRKVELDIEGLTNLGKESKLDFFFLKSLSFVKVWLVTQVTKFYWCFGVLYSGSYLLLYDFVFCWSQEPINCITLLEQKLKKNCEVDYEVKIYPGQTHGFVHRTREDISPQDKPYIEEGRKDMINWLNKYI